MSNSTRFFKLSAAAAALVLAGSVYAGGFGLYSNSVSSMGSAYSGAAAAGKDASYDSFNAAQAAFMKKTQVSVGVAVIPYEIKNKFAGSGKNYDYKHTAMVPNLHVVHKFKFNKQLAFAFDISAPYGLQTKYSWENTNYPTPSESSIAVVRYNPSIAYKVNSTLAVAVGVDYNTGTAELGTYLPAGVGPAGQGNYVNDLSGDGTGWNLGLLYKMNKSTRVGLGYYSATKLKAKGTLKLAGNKLDDVNSSLDFPDMVTFSVYHDFSPKLDAGFTMFYNGWSSMQEIKITGPTSGTSSLTLDYKNTLYYALGADYKWKQLVVSAGVGYDETPTVDAHRDIRMPDTNRTILSLGVHYKLAGNVKLDAAFQHFMGKEVNVNLFPAAGAPTGKTTGSANEFAVAANVTF